MTIDIYLVENDVDFLEVLRDGLMSHSNCIEKTGKNWMILTAFRFSDDFTKIGLVFSCHICGLSIQARLEVVQGDLISKIEASAVKSAQITNDDGKLQSVRKDNNSGEVR